MNDFKCRHFRGEIVLWAVRWYCKLRSRSTLIPTVRLIPR